eukprot:998823-Pyramimonas_sp.AAC.1
MQLLDQEPRLVKIPLGGVDIHDPWDGLRIISTAATNTPQVQARHEVLRLIAAVFEHGLGQEVMFSSVASDSVASGCFAASKACTTTPQQIMGGVRGGGENSQE